MKQRSQMTGNPSTPSTVSGLNSPLSRLERGLHVRMFSENEDILCRNDLS